MTGPATIKAPPATEFTLTWEGPLNPLDGEPDDAHFLGGRADPAAAEIDALEFARTAHADFHGGTVNVRDQVGRPVFVVALPMPVDLEVCQ